MLPVSHWWHVGFESPWVWPSGLDDPTLRAATTSFPVRFPGLEPRPPARLHACSPARLPPTSLSRVSCSVRLRYLLSCDTSLTPPAAVLVIKTPLKALQASAAKGAANTATGRARAEKLREGAEVAQAAADATGELERTREALDAAAGQSATLRDRLGMTLNRLPMKANELVQVRLAVVRVVDAAKRWPRLASMGHSIVHHATDP